MTPHLHTIWQVGALAPAMVGLCFCIESARLWTDTSWIVWTRTLIRQRLAALGHAAFAAVMFGGALFLATIGA